MEEKMKLITEITIRDAESERKARIESPENSVNHHSNVVDFIARSLKVGQRVVAVETFKE